MSQLCPKIPDVCRRVVVVRRYIRVLWERAFMNASAVCKPRQYQPLARGASSAPTPSPAPYDALIDLSSVGGYGNAAPIPPPPVVVPDRLGDVKDSDLVSMKISLLGDRQTGKTSFLAKYVGNEKDHRSDLGGLGYTDKIQCVQGARLFFSIWEVGGNVHCQEDNIPAACRDSVAILFMFDLTSRRTLNSVIEWYQEARKWNQTAIPILIGTKFDDFVQLPIDLQWTIASQARRYAKALNATLFFSSSAYNINVNKVFKFITAKLFNLPWSVERNLTIGEPIIDF